MQREPDHCLKRVDRAIRAPRHAMLPRWKARALGGVRLTIVLLRDLVGGDLTPYTMSLDAGMVSAPDTTTVRDLVANHAGSHDAPSLPE